MTRNVLAVAATLVLLGCGESSREKSIKEIRHDEEVLKRVNAAVNEVVRNAPDCDVAKPLMAEAYQRIEEARGQLNAPASGATLGALKAQVDRVARVCP